MTISSAGTLQTCLDMKIYLEVPEANPSISGGTAGCVVAGERFRIVE